MGVIEMTAMSGCLSAQRKGMRGLAQERNERFDRILSRFAPACPPAKCAARKWA